MGETLRTCWFLEDKCPKCKKHSLATDGFDVWCSAGETTCDYYWNDGYEAIRLVNGLKDLNRGSDD